MDEFKQAISAGLVAARNTTKADIARGQELPGQYVGRWVSFTAPDGYEAWCDTPGTLDIEVPTELVDELVAFVEVEGVRCGVERNRDGAVLHCNTRLAPVPALAPEGGE